MNNGTTVERQGSEIVIRIPMELKRRGGRKAVIVPQGLEETGEVQAQPQEPLVRALARAFAWQEMLEGGRFGTVGKLAEALGVDRCYVRRVLGLACLAPDIVQAIVEGREPSGLSLEGLVKGVPMGWEEQRTKFGFGPGIPAGRQTALRG